MARTHEPIDRPLWRVFPWNADAEAGEPFSPQWVPPSQGQGRFDLPGAPGGVIYFAETAAHAVAEMIHHYRGQPLDQSDLVMAAHPLALVRVAIPSELLERLADLCDPNLLARLAIRPDETASAERRTTQRIAARLHADGYGGLRWWSALRGDWHTVVLFRDRLDPRMVFEDPERLTVSHPAVREATRELGMRVGGRR